MLRVCLGCDKEQSAGQISGDTCVQSGRELCGRLSNVLFPEAFLNEFVGFCPPPLKKQNFRNMEVYQDHSAAFLDLRAQLYMSSLTRHTACDLIDLFKNSY